MLLRELVEQLGLDITLQPLANEIEVSDSFIDNPLVNSDESQIKIYCTENTATRVLCFDLDKEVIIDLFELENRTGGNVYSFEGFIIQII